MAINWEKGCCSMQYQAPEKNGEIALLTRKYGAEVTLVEIFDAKTNQEKSSSEMPNDEADALYGQ